MEHILTLLLNGLFNHCIVGANAISADDARTCLNFNDNFPIQTMFFTIYNFVSVKVKYLNVSDC